MKSAALFLTLLCTDITPEIDDKIESENQTTGAAVAAPANAGNPETITLDEAQELKAIAASEIAQLSDLDGKDVAILGKVHSVYIPKSGSLVILNMGDDFKTCSKVIIEDRSFQRWNRSAKEIGALYEGKTLVCEGLVGLFKNLPQVKVSEPTQLRVVK